MGKSIKYYFRQFKRPPVWLFLFPVYLIRIMRFFMRSSIIDSNNCLNTETYPYITVTWHNRLLFFPAMFPGYARKRTVAMISASRDGEYVANIVKLFGIGTVRGSTSRRGAAALKSSIEMLEKGINVSMTPDGPRGPRYVLSKGPVLLGAKTGIPVLPIGVNYSSFWELRSWDRFRIPKPWAKLELIIGTPIYIKADLSDDEVEEYRLKIELELNNVSGVTEKELSEKREKKR